MLFYKAFYGYFHRPESFGMVPEDEKQIHQPINYISIPEKTLFVNIPTNLISQTLLQAFPIESLPDIS